MPVLKYPSIIFQCALTYVYKAVPWFVVKFITDRVHSVKHRKLISQNYLKDLVSSCKTDLDLWDCFGGDIHLKAAMNKIILHIYGFFGKVSSRLLNE